MNRIPDMRACGAKVALNRLTKFIDRTVLTTEALAAAHDLECACKQRVLNKGTSTEAIANATFEAKLAAFEAAYSRQPVPP